MVEQLLPSILISQCAQSLYLIHSDLHLVLVCGVLSVSFNYTAIILSVVIEWERPVVCHDIIVAIILPINLIVILAQKM